MENETLNDIDLDVELISDTEDLSTDELKDLVGKLINIVKTQNLGIDSMERKTQANETRNIYNTNDINDLSTRVVELEKYSRKLCLIINNLEYSDNPVQDVLQLLQSLNIAFLHPI